MAHLSPDVTWNFYMKDASIYYNEDMDCLMIYSDHTDKVILDGITLFKHERSISQGLVHQNLDKQEEKEVT